MKLIWSDTSMTEGSIVGIAFLSRFIVLLMQVITNWLVEDHEPDIFNPPDVGNNHGLADDVVEFLLSGFRRWDGIYFLHVAEHGYTYENTLAFFPGYPLLTKMVGLALQYPLGRVLTMRHILMLSGYLVNLVAFVLTAMYIFKLARELIGKGHHPWFAAVLFCFNPASVFMSAAYSESLFALASFAHMYHLERKEYTKATAALFIAVLTRSNGLVLIGYPLYKIARLLLSNNSQERKFFNIIRLWLQITSCIMYGALPFIVYQFIGFIIYCKNRTFAMHTKIREYGIDKGYHLPSDEPNEWCYYRLPISYNYIQKNHWNVGFLQYYEAKQLPNFFLAMPGIILSLYSIFVYINKCKDALLEVRSLRPWIDSRPMRFFPYCLHLLFLVIYGLTSIHVQVMTRLIFSSSPLIYFFLARYTSQYFIAKINSRIFKSFMVYFVIYFVVGTLVFSNHLPWT